MVWYLRIQGSSKVRSNPHVLNVLSTIFAKFSRQYWNTSVAENSLPPKTDCFIFCHFLTISIYYDAT